jgi:hypothetical protein
VHRETCQQPGDTASTYDSCRALVRLEVELVAIERPDGLLVEQLLDAGPPQSAIGGIIYSVSSPTGICWFDGRSALGDV